MKIILVILTLLSNHLLLASSTFEFKANQGKVEFKTKGWPNLVNIKGTGEGLTGVLTESDKKISGSLTFNLTTLDTGISLRDEHMKNKYLQVSQFPHAELKLVNLILPENLNSKFEFKGELNLHGVKKELTGFATISSSEDEIKLIAEASLALTDYQIEIPNYQGITVADKVTIMIESKVIRKE